MEGALEVVAYVLASADYEPAVPQDEGWIGEPVDGRAPDSGPGPVGVGTVLVWGEREPLIVPGPSGGSEDPSVREQSQVRREDGASLGDAPPLAESRGWLRAQPGPSPLGDISTIHSPTGQDAARGHRHERARAPRFFIAIPANVFVEGPALGRGRVTTRGFPARYPLERRNENDTRRAHSHPILRITRTRLEDARVGQATPATSTNINLSFSISAVPRRWGSALARANGTRRRRSRHRRS